MTTQVWGRAASSLVLALCLAGAAKAETAIQTAPSDQTPSDQAPAAGDQAPASPQAAPKPQPYYGPAPPNVNNAPVGARVSNALDLPGGREKGYIGPFRPLSDYLGNYGISLRGVLINQYANNPTGGVHQGNDNVGQLNFGFDVDLNKAVGIPGGSFHVTVYRDYGFSLAKDTVGTLFKEQNIYKNAYPQLHMGLVAYEQKLLQDKLDIIVGRLGTTAFYGHLNSTCNFESALACGIPTILNSEAGYGLLPSATWGANVTYHFTHEVYFETGAYEVNPFIQHTNGWDWSTKYATGVTTPFELVWSRPDLKTEAYPFELKFGGYTTTAPHADPLYNTKGQSLGAFGGTALNDQTRDGLYLLGDRVMWRPDRSSNENLNVFAGFVQSLESEEIIRQEVFLGGVLTGVIPGRPYDVIAVQGGYLQLSPREIEFLDESRVKAGGTGKSSPDQGVLEASYGWQVMPSVKLMPDLQYIINPDNSQIPKINFVPKNAVVIGLYLSVGVSSILGFKGAGSSSD